MVLFYLLCILYVCVNNFFTVVAWQQRDRNSNPQPFDHIFAIAP